MRAPSALARGNRVRDRAGRLIPPMHSSSALSLNTFWADWFKGAGEISASMRALACTQLLSPCTTSGKRESAMGWS
eukprot:6483648-Amphidinium_carterae.1